MLAMQTTKATKGKASKTTKGNNILDALSKEAL
jgi:hypothetical protein